METFKFVKDVCIGRYYFNSTLATLNPNHVNASNNRHLLSHYPSSLVPSWGFD
jgi:hypothetical protein